MKSSPFLSSGNAGEFSPRMEGRVDFEKYGAAIARAKNLVCLPEGPLTFRPGTRFVSTVASSSQISHLIPFEPVSTRSYMIEAGDSFMRFFRNQAQMFVEATSTVITNGDFPANIAGWTNLSTGSGSIAWSAGSMAIAGAGDGFGWAEQHVTVSIADAVKTHVLRFAVTSDNYPESTIAVRIGYTSGSANLVNLRGLGMGWHSIGFEPDGSNLYIQFVNEGATTVLLDGVNFLSGQALSVVSPYAAAETPDIRPSQSADVAYLFHGSHRPYRLERRGDSTWSMVRTFFADGPWGETNPETDLQAANLVANGRFDGGLAGWTQAVTAQGFVDYSTSNRFVFLRRYDAAGTAAIQQAVATGSPAALHVLHFQIVGGGTTALSIGTAAGAADIVAATNYNAGWYSVSFTPAVTPFYLQFLCNQDDAIAGGVGGVFCYTTSARLLQASGTTGSITVTALGAHAPFVATDVGRLLRIEHAGREPGWGTITGYTSTQVVAVRLHRNIASTVPTETWRLGAWSDTTGWPASGTFHQQRLLAARTAAQSQTIWGSQSGDFENMRPDTWREGATTVEDDDALNFTLATRRVSPIYWMTSSRRLLIGTGTGQIAVGSKGPVLTPSDFAADPQSSIKTRNSLPLEIDNVTVFTHLAKRGIYEIAFSFTQDSYAPADLTQLARHRTKGKVKQLAYQEEPFSQIWALLEDGTLSCQAYKRTQNVAGWTSVEMATTETGGVVSPAVVESIAVIPGAVATDGQLYNSDDRDELWLIVRRVIAGFPVRYIEVMEGYYEGPNRSDYLDRLDWLAQQQFDQQNAFYVDCGVSYVGAPVTSLGGLGHLEGQTVQVVADGYVAPPATVTGGAITLRTPAFRVHAGLGYDWFYRGLKLPYGARGGPLQSIGTIKGVQAIVFSLLDSASFELAVDHDGLHEFKVVPFRTAKNHMTASIPLFTGETRITPEGGFDTDPRIVLRGSLPLPWTLVGMSPEMDAPGD